LVEQHQHVAGPRVGSDELHATAIRPSHSSIGRSRSGARRRPGIARRTRPARGAARTPTAELRSRSPFGSGSAGRKPRAWPLAASSASSVQRWGSNLTSTFAGQRAGQDVVDTGQPPQLRRDLALRGRLTVEAIHPQPHAAAHGC